MSPSVSRCLTHILSLPPSRSNEAVQTEHHPLADILPCDLLDLCRLYPDPYSRDLRAKLAAKAPGAVGGPAQLLIDSGGDSVICLVLRSRIVASDTVVTSAGTYPTFSYFSLGLGAKVVEVPYLDEGGAAVRPDLAALASTAQEHKAAVVYLANPDNPTGHVYGQVSPARPGAGFAVVHAD